jgi:hypothetical protein
MIWHGIAAFRNAVNWTDQITPVKALPIKSQKMPQLPLALSGPVYGTFAHLRK